MSNGWPVDFVPVGDVCEEMWSIRAGDTCAVKGDELAPYPETPMQPPSTVGLVKGGANGSEAQGAGGLSAFG